MISYGSQQHHAEMPYEDCSHQLGKGQASTAAMPLVSHPSRLVYGRNTTKSQQCQTAIDTFHQLGKGQSINTEMSGVVYPSLLVLGSHVYHAAMPIHDRSHLFTRGRCVDAAMLNKYRLSRGGSDDLRSNVTSLSPFLTSLREPIELRRNANLNYLPPILTRGQSRYAAMPRSDRLLKEGS